METVLHRYHCTMHQEGDLGCISGVGVSLGAYLCLFLGVQCYETETGYRCGPCPAGYTGTYAQNQIRMIKLSSTNKLRCYDSVPGGWGLNSILI